MHKPDVVQHGHDLRTGELQRKEKEAVSFDDAVFVEFQRLTNVTTRTTIRIPSRPATINKRRRLLKVLTRLARRAVMCIHRRRVRRSRQPPSDLRVARILR